MKKELFYRILTSIILFPFSIFIIVKGSFLFLLFILLCFLISIYEWQRMKISKFSKFLGTLLLLISFFLIYNFRLNLGENYWPFIFILLICISTDMGGYVFGKTFKGPKLTSISPKKTYAGMIGSFIFCVVLFFVLLVMNFINKEFILSYLIFILIISSVSQIGDIFISYFKRLSNIKDTGNLIPGHGGLLDRIDGMIFAFPISYLFLSTEFFSFIL